MDIAALKEEARALEQRGRPAEALALYRKALARLEGTQDIWRELPLYVKAGDLNLKLRDGKTAITMYERAAKRYAQYGSAKSVLALCSKILRVSPSRTYVFLAFARVMIERGHVAEAAKVLAGYAELVKLGKAHEVIQRLVDARPDETRPVLEMLLEVAGRAENAKLKATERPREEADHGSLEVSKETDRRGSSSREDEAQSPPDGSATTGERLRVTDGTGATGPRRAVPHEAEDTAPVEPRGSEGRLSHEERDSVTRGGAAGTAQPDSNRPGETVSKGARVAPAPAEGLDSPGEEAAVDDDTFRVVQGYTPMPGAEALYRAKQAVEQAAGLDFSPTIEPPPKQEPTDRPHAKRVEWPAPPRPGPRQGGGGVRPRPSLTHSGPRQQQPFTTRRPKASKRGWVWVLLAVIVVGGGGAALVLAGVIGGRGGGVVGGTPAARPVDVPPGDSQVAPAPADSAELAGGREPEVVEGAGTLLSPSEQGVQEVVDTGARGLPAPDLPVQLADSLDRAVPDVSIDTMQTREPQQPEVAAPTESVAAEPTLPDLPPDVVITRPIIVIRGLPIESVTEFPDGEHRVVQLLGSSERLVLTARPVSATVSDTVVAGVVTVREMLGASTVGSVRHAEHLVEAQGRVGADTLRMLLGRLAEIRP